MTRNLKMKETLIIICYETKNMIQILWINLKFYNQFVILTSRKKDINSNELSPSTTSINKSNNKLIQIADTIPNQLLTSNQISYYTSLSSSSIIKKFPYKIKNEKIESFLKH